MLTSIESLKILQDKIGIKLKEHSNVFLDISNTINIPSENKIYPCIIKLDHGKLQLYQFQSPANSQAFENLKTRLKSQN